jgi:succinate-semialdehyde dehydrogenase/glutarate-semialdehyde dehydrogenase
MIGTELPRSVTAEATERLAARVSAAPDAERESMLAPYSGAPICPLPRSSEADVVRAFEVARRAQAAWSATPIAERCDILLRFHDLLLERQREALDLIQLENGKARRDAYLEVADIALTSRYYARMAERLLSPHRRHGAFPVLTLTTEHRRPKGVVGLISPWNYPLSLGAGDTIPALLAGNAVVQKPDNQTALTALWALDLLEEAGLPAGVWQIVLGSPDTIGPPLLAHADYLMFTGSTAAGRAIAARAASRLVGCSLELGGKNAMVVLDDADIGRASEGAVRACFSSSGQLCISIERLYVAERCRDEFEERFLQRVRAMRLGGHYDYSCDMGSLTSRAQLERVEAHVEDARRGGATVLAGGRARPDLGPLFYEPTVLAGVTDPMTCHRSETFGPVVSLYSFGEVEEAIALANDSPYGLNASVWSRDGERGRAVAARLHAGTVNVNEAFAATYGSVDAPMGGMGDSGLGRRHGSEGILKYTEAQTIAHQRLLGFTPPRGVPYPTWVGAMNVALRAMKKVGMR